MKFNLLLAVILVGLSPKYQAQYQFNLMEEYLQIGSGNYFVHLDKENEVKKNRYICVEGATLHLPRLDF